MTSSNTIEDRVQDAVKHFGATITGITDDGDVDFSLDSIGGLARERHGQFRVSFFIAVDPDSDDAERFVAAHNDLPCGEAQFVEHNGGTFVRLLVELPFDDGQQIWTTAQTARALRAGWLNREDGGLDLVTTLASAGIAMPPLGPLAQSAIHAYGPWSWGSRYLPPIVLYMFEVEFVARQLIAHNRLFALAHAGHGINSYGLNLVTSAGPVAVYVQHGYGGGYANPVHDLIDINATYSRLHVLLHAAAGLPGENSRWLIVYSQFRGALGVVDLDRLRTGETLDQATEAFDSEPAVFEALVERLGLDNFDLGTGRHVSW